VQKPGAGETKAEEIEKILGSLAVDDLENDCH